MDAHTTGTPHPAHRPSVDLDAAIDVVAREMTEMSPPASLRAQVLDRIEQERRHPGFAVPRWAWAGVLAAVTVAVATTIWINRPLPAPRATETTVAEQRSGGPNVPAAVSGRSAVQPAGGLAETAAPLAGHKLLGVRAQRVPAARGAQSAAETAADAVAEAAALVPPLADIEPLRFSLVEPAPLDIPVVEVSPLNPVPTIDIPSLNPGSTDPPSADPKKEK